jgi:outer membrane protein assembly factor BamB
MFPLALLLTVFVASAETWPQWRGPRGTGLSGETGLPAEWSRDKNIAWKAPLGGLGVSSPIVWGDRVFVTYQKGYVALRQGRHPTFIQDGDPASAGERPLGGARTEPTSERVFLATAAFDRATGRPLWEHVIAAEGPVPTVHEKRNLATASAITDGERIYSWFSNGQMTALGLDGKPQWSRHLGRDYGNYDIEWGHASSPALYRGLLILLCYHGNSSYLLALDKRTGKEAWRTRAEKGAKSYSTPLVVETPDGPELIVNSTERVEAFDPRTGKQLWHFTEANRFAVPMPVYHDGVLYLSRGYRSSPYMAIRAGGRGDIAKTHVLWKMDNAAPYVSSLIHVDGMIYMASELGIVTCIDPKTGERVWRERVGGIFTASPAAAGGLIYLVSETGETVVLRAGRTPQVVSRNAIGEQTIASPAISNGQIFLRTDRHLFAIGKPGAERK